MKKKNNKHGFTLAELLIVVAIIAVLTAIAIPVFNTQLEKARESTDLANIRAAYAEVMVDALENETAADLKKEVKLKQVVTGWVTANAVETLNTLCGDATYMTLTNPAKDGTAVITWVPASGSGTSAVEGHCTIAPKTA